jgi:hypothetical protein
MRVELSAALVEIAGGVELGADPAQRHALPRLVEADGRLVTIGVDLPLVMHYAPGEWEQKLGAAAKPPGER